jgi:hypothetical protein
MRMVTELAKLPAAYREVVASKRGQVALFGASLVIYDYGERAEVAKILFERWPEDRQRRPRKPRSSSWRSASARPPRGA